MFKIKACLVTLNSEDSAFEWTFCINKNSILEKQIKTVVYFQAAKFHIPVPRSQTDYYEKISEPMDLGTIRKNVKNHKYSDR